MTKMLLNTGILRGKARGSSAGFRLWTGWLALFLFASGSSAATYFVAKTGSDSNPGTQSAPWLTIQYAAHHVSPGDTILVNPGFYKEQVTLDSVTNLTLRATGPNTYIGWLFIETNNVEVDGFQFVTNSVLPEFANMVTISSAASHAQIVNCTFDDATPGGNYYGIGFQNIPGVLTPDGGPHDCLVSNNVFISPGLAAIQVYGSNNVVTRNLVTGPGTDFVHLWGCNNAIYANVVSNFGGIGHADFIQTFGLNGFASYSNVIAGNMILNSSVQVGQLEQNGANIHDWFFCNNVFAGVAGSGGGHFSTYWWNNSFYKAVTNTASVMIFDGTNEDGGRGVCSNGICVNNIFLKCGIDPSSTSKGWYDIPNDQTNVWADFNFVAGSNYAAKAEGPPRSEFVWYEMDGINGGNPLLYSESVPDCRLQAGSFLIGKGTNLTAWIHAMVPTGLWQYCTNDAAGNPMPPTGNWDIGAYQHTQQTGTGNYYYVSPAGNDSNSGTQAQPWRTIQKAADMAGPGDTILVSPGNYGETVVTTTNGTPGHPITFLASPPNDPNNQVIVRDFRVQNRYITIDGFNITGASGANNAAIRLDYNGSTVDSSDCVITNNTIRDGVFLLSRDTDFGSNYIHSVDGNFNAAGFRAGSLIFLGSDSMFQYSYTNHDTAHTVSSVSADGHYLYVTDTLLPDPGSNYFCLPFAGQDNSGFKGILFTLSGGSAPTNCLIVGNTFSNLFGANVVIYGSGNIVKDNRFLAMHGWPAIQFQGPNTVIQDNLFLNSPNVEYFTPEDFTSVEHPTGGNYYDFQSSLLGSFSAGVTNCLILHNWFQNCANQLALMQQASGSGGFIFRSNVFVGFPYGGSFSSQGPTFDHNTFYRDAFGLEQGSAFGAGARTGYQSNLVVTSNVFVNVGSHWHIGSEGYFNLAASTNYIIRSNYCTSAETMGWAPIARNSNVGISINGGDPLFVNAANPLGPDGLPFTADDGLRPLPNSPLAKYGLGAEPALSNTNPIAHFRETSVTNWQDDTTTNFDPAWAALAPHQRTNNIRPYATPEALGSANLTVNFDASASIDGLGTGNAGIQSYAWDFGDGGSAVSSSPTTSHTYTSGGTFIVTLTITNNLGATSSYSNAYRIFGQTTSTGTPPAPPSNLRVLSF